MFCILFYIANGHLSENAHCKSVENSCLHRTPQLFIYWMLFLDPYIYWNITASLSSDSVATYNEVMKNMGETKLQLKPDVNEKEK